MERAQVEAITERREIACGILLKVEGMIATRQTGSEITENGVDPLELGHILGLAPGHHGRVVAATGVCHGSKASQSIGGYSAVRSHIALRPSRNRRAGEARNRRQAHAQRAILPGQGNRRNDRNLVLGAPPNLATGALSTEIGVIRLDIAFKHIAVLPVSHHLHQLVLDQPDGGITHAQLPPQRQGRQSGLGLADEVDCQKLGGQRQLGSLKDRPGNQRGLVTAGDALKNLAHTVSNDVIRSSCASGAMKSFRPARGLKRLLTLHLVTKVLEKFRHRQPWLKLDSVHCHDCHPLLVDGSHFTRQQAHYMSPADVRC